MLSVQEAQKIVQKQLPDGKIQASISYGDLYIFQVFTEDPFEEEDDPFFSVHKRTGEFKDFSVLTDGNTAEIISLFTEARRTKE
jgi:hypothetical protein